MPLNAPPPIYVYPSQIPKFVTILFHNGTRHRFDTAEQAEDYVKSLRWEHFWDHQHFREVVASETYERSWGDIELDTDGTSRDFLQEMERADYFTVGFHFVDEE